MGSVGTVDLDIRANAQSIPAEVMKQLNAAAAQFKTVASQMAKTMDTVGAKVEQGLTKPLSQASIAGSKTYGWLKDIGRIVQGIFISQILYRGILQPLQNAVSELWNFRTELEKTQIAMTYFLDKSIAGVEELIDKFEILAAKTPFTFPQVVDTAKLLLRYGFSEQQLLPMMAIMIDTASAFNLNALEMENFARALGQVMAKGRLMSEEAVRQLSQLLPMAQILREELGLSITDLGDVYVDAKTGIMAILSWLTKFQGAAKKAEGSMGGLISSISDFLTFIGSELFSSTFERIKIILENIRATLERVRIAVKQAGFKGLLVAMFPPEVAKTIIIIINQIKILGKSLLNLIKAFSPLGKAIMEINIRLLQAFLPAIVAILQILTPLVKVISNITPLIYSLAGAIIALSIAKTVAFSVEKLNIAINGLSLLITKRPIVMGIILLIGALAGLALQSEYVRQKLHRLFGEISSFFGIDTELPTIDFEAEDIDFGGLEDIADGFENIGGAADDATGGLKKFLASFDEVYQIPESTGDSDAGFGLDDWSIPDFSLGDVIQDELEDVADALEDFLNIPWWEKALYGLVPFWRQIWDFLKGIFKKIKGLKFPEIPKPPTLEWGVIPVKSWAEQIAEAFARFRTDLAEEFKRVWKEALEVAIPGMASDFSLAINTALVWGMLQLNFGLAISSLLFTKLQSAFETVISKLPELASQLGTGLQFTIAWAITKTFSLWFMTAVLWAGAVTWIKNGFKAVNEWVVDQSDAPWLTSLVKALAIALGTALIYLSVGTLAPYVQAWIATTFGGTAATGAATAAGTAIVVGVNKGMVEEAKTIGNELSLIIKDIPSTIQSTVDTTGKSIGFDIIGGLTKGMQEKQKEDETALDTVAKNIKNRFAFNFGIKSPSTVFDAFGVETMQGFINGIDNMLSFVKDKMSDVYNRVAEKIIELGTKASGWGSSIIDGLISGINSKIGALKSAIASAIKSAINKAKETLGIESPSKVFAEIGNNVALGFVKGVDDSSAILAKSMQNLLPLNNLKPVSAQTYATANNASPVQISDSLTGTDIKRLISSLNTNNSINTGSTPNIADDYVLVPVNKRDLERELFVIRQGEILRRGV